MGFSCGIVGLPNVGKSTLFNILTGASVDAENYPFCTIDPNIALVSIPDERLDNIFEKTKAGEKIPAVLKFYDIAGLVKGASKGEGLGNQFLSHIRDVDVICHVVRLFSEPDIVHTGEINPVGDLETVETELALKDLEILEKRKEKLERRIRSQSDKEAVIEKDLIKLLEEKISQGEKISQEDLDETQVKLLDELGLLTLKPAFVISNVDSPDDIKLENYKNIEKYCKEKKYLLVPVSVKIEKEIAELPIQERKDFLLDFGLEDLSIKHVVSCGFKLLNLLTFYTVKGFKEARAWELENGTSAKKAAGKIHSDMEKGFIKAEVLSYEEFVEFGDFLKAREAGRLRIEGKNYIVQDGDIVEFRFQEN